MFHICGLKTGKLYQQAMCYVCVLWSRKVVLKLPAVLFDARLHKSEPNVSVQTFVVRVKPKYELAVNAPDHEMCAHALEKNSNKTRFRTDMVRMERGGLYRSSCPKSLEKFRAIFLARMRRPKLSRHSPHVISRELTVSSKTIHVTPPPSLSLRPSLSQVYVFA